MYNLIAICCYSILPSQVRVIGVPSITLMVKCGKGSTYLWLYRNLFVQVYLAAHTFSYRPHFGYSFEIEMRRYIKFFHFLYMGKSHQRTLISNVRCLGFKKNLIFGRLMAHRHHPKKRSLL